MNVGRDSKRCPKPFTLSSGRNRFSEDAKRLIVRDDRFLESISGQKLQVIDREACLFAIDDDSGEQGFCSTLKVTHPSFITRFTDDLGRLVDFLGGPYTLCLSVFKFVPITSFWQELGQPRRPNMLPSEI